jgi:hypothetical protein
VDLTAHRRPDALNDLHVNRSDYGWRIGGSRTVMTDQNDAGIVDQQGVVADAMGESDDE